MAFHGSVLPNMAAAAMEAWPSIANTLTAPWKSATLSSRRADGSTATSNQSNEPTPARQQASLLPDFLRDSTARPQLLPNMPTSRDMAATSIQSTVSSMSRVGLRAANPMLRRPFFQPQSPSSPAFVRTFMRSGFGTASAAPSISTASRFGAQFGTTQRRGFGSSGGISRNQLATVEESANRNPGNANLQNAFYQLLLRANMPGILVERYQSGRFATSPATEEAYKKALMALNAGANATANSVAPSGYARGQWSGHEQGFGASAASGNSLAANSMGAKGEPIHVVVQESTRSLIFRWVKFFATFVVVTYLCFAAVTILIETLSTFRRGPGAKNDSEVKAEKQTTRFNDVHGCDEAKEELQEVVEFLRNPEKFSDLGAKLPKGVLLVGPPGTGKTLLARAVAGEAGVPFFYMSGSEFDEIFVGVGAKRVRELFAAAKAKSPAIIFIDELDAIGGKRNPRDQAHAKQTLNQLLTELDGFDQDTKIIIMGATNLPKLLDKALTRPGRFDRHVNVDLPDVRGRLAILQHHAKKLKCAPDVDMEAVAARSPGRSGAELENMLNLAALRASRARATMVSKHDLDWAFDRITMGSERKSMVVTEKEKEMTAYHEAGHALVQLFDKESSSQLYKVTILPKGPSLGHTAHVPQMDKYSYTAAEYMANIRVLLGGKMAEEMRYGGDKVTSGVSNDLEKATDLSFMMVTHFGMSTALGPVEYGRRYENLSSETRSMIEGEVQRSMKKSYEDVRKLLTEKRKELDLLAQALVQYETLDKAEVELVIRGEKLPGRSIVPKGPLVLPIPDDAPQPPGLGGVPHPHPPDSPAPPAAAESTGASS
ncbi:Mitochondrial inner membrane i-AAA protease supercomplex subunit YME1 [Tolypocladium capitatum]|uniref:Mitochondrial inner membrane i-AAA protease supercomplex subunit YME1 n=1 Tax=Tolypocladium capitatum TaxID=45235 RepID=A0A2K3QLP2_9HYPO|nr:Mitochondrial inner membrane i-AAA protease supercomplex subunit YME1 [Tolypocladium capitatum]